MANQHVRYCKSFDGAEIAYAVTGEGPAVVMLPSWLTHLEYQWRSVAWQPWLEALSSRYRLIRYDPRGCGLSDRDLDNLSFEYWVRDFGAVVDAVGLDRFSLVGICQGGPTAIEFTASQPDRVSQLVLYGTYARGRNRRTTPPEPQKAKLMLEMMELGWADEDHAFMPAFATQFQPQGSMEHLRSWCELQRAAASAATAVQLTRVRRSAHPPLNGTRVPPFLALSGRVLCSLGPWSHAGSRQVCEDTFQEVKTKPRRRPSWVLMLFQALALASLPLRCTAPCK